MNCWERVEYRPFDWSCRRGSVTIKDWLESTKTPQFFFIRNSFVPVRNAYYDVPRFGDLFYGISFRFTCTFNELEQLEKKKEYFKNTVLYDHDWFVRIIESYLFEMPSLPDVKVQLAGEYEVVTWDPKKHGFLAEHVTSENDKHTWIITPLHPLLKAGLPLIALQFIMTRVMISPKEDTTISDVRYYYSMEPDKLRRYIAQNPYCIDYDDLRLVIMGGCPRLYKF